MLIKIPKPVTTVIEKLVNNGFEAYLVGGCLRNMLMRRVPRDYDIVTSALPFQVKKIFDKVIPTGEKHGTLTVLENNEHVEVTTFEHDLRDDLSRRDFTINSLAMGVDNKIYDYFGGIDDIKNNILKTVGSPENRFREDPLRIMRAVRFSVEFNFNLSAEITSAIISLCHLIKSISAERIRDELTKILLSENPSFGIDMLQKFSLLKFIIPELEQCVGFNQKNKYHDKDVFRHTLAVLENTPRGLNIRLAALLHDIAKPKTFMIDENGEGHFHSHNTVGEIMARDILGRLKYSNDTVKAVSILIKEHTNRYNILSTHGIKKLIKRIGPEHVNELFDLQISDIKGSAFPWDTGSIEKMREEVNLILAKKEPLSVKDLAINGNDLIEMGFTSGTKIGFILKTLLEEVLQNPQLNTYDCLKSIVKEKSFPDIKSE